MNLEKAIEAIKKGKRVFAGRYKLELVNGVAHLIDYTCQGLPLDGYEIEEEKKIEVWKWVYRLKGDDDPDFWRFSDEYLPNVKELRKESVHTMLNCTPIIASSRFVKDIWSNK